MSNQTNWTISQACGRSACSNQQCSSRSLSGSTTQTSINSGRSISSCLSPSALLSSSPIDGGLQRRQAINTSTSRQWRPFGPQRSQKRLKLVTLASTDTETDTGEELQVEGIDRAYCDEFVCTSSPQVEQNVRALARDVARLTTWTSDLFRKDVKYKDAFLSCTGVQKHGRILFPRDCMNNPKVLVTKLKMLDRGKCQVDWRLRGSIIVFPVDIDFASEFGLDLITGRVNSHNERWDLSRLSPPSKLAFTASRIAWTLKLRGQGIKDESAQLLEKWKPKNEDQGNITQDMNDPTKFFEEDDPSKDLFAVGAILAFIYFIYQAYTEISKLK